MDASTQELYTAVRALSDRFGDTSIEPYTLIIEGPRKFVDDRFRSDWPKNLKLDMQVVGCLRRHMQLENAPRVQKREQSLDEAVTVMEDLRCEAKRQGFTPQSERRS